MYGTRLTIRINQPFEMSQYIACTMKGVMMDRRTTRFLYLGILVSSVLWGGLAVNQAEAGSITYTFAGTVTNVMNAPNVSGSPFNTSQTMSGQMTVNPAANPASPTNNHPIQSLTVNIGGYQANLTGPGYNFSVTNSIPDRLSLFLPVSGAPVNTSYTPSYFSIDLRGPQSLFNSTALPTTVPSISSFTVKNEWRLYFSGGKVVVGQMSQLTAVPLPAAVVLFGAGLVALVGLGAGSWRPKRSQLAA